MGEGQRGERGFTTQRNLKGGLTFAVRCGGDTVGAKGNGQPKKKKGKRPSEIFSLRGNI
jgi:hypothetical protein